MIIIRNKDTFRIHDHAFAYMYVRKKYKIKELLLFVCAEIPIRRKRTYMKSKKRENWSV